MPIAHHIRNLPVSGIRRFFNIVQSVPEVITLGIGEPDFETPECIRNAAIQSISKGKIGYTANLGSLALREAISNYVASQFQIQYQPDQEILVTVGVSEAIDLALRALINPGDEVLYHEPCYVSYLPSIALAHGVPVAIPTHENEDFILKADALEKKITKKSKVLLLNYPTNPTGATMPLSELQAIAAVCQKYDLIVLTDEIYSELTYDNAPHYSIAALPGMKERTLFLHGVSKAFAMTGFRIGFACGPAEIIEAMMKIHQYGILCAPTISQDAAIAALTEGTHDMIRMRDAYQERRDYLSKSLNALNLHCKMPKGAFYIFADIRSTGFTSQEFAMRLLAEKKVAVVPGDAFGKSGEGYIRCSYASSLTEIKKAVSLMDKFLNH